MSVVVSGDARSLPRLRGFVFLPVSSVGRCTRWCPLPVSEGVMFQRWIAFPVFIDCCRTALDKTAFRYISGRGSFDGLSWRNGVEKRGGETLKHHLGYNPTHRHWSQPRCSPSCFLCFHCALIGSEQTTTSGGKALYLMCSELQGERFPCTRIPNNKCLDAMK